MKHYKLNSSPSAKKGYPVAGMASDDRYVGAHALRMTAIGNHHG